MGQLRPICGGLTVRDLARRRTEMTVLHLDGSLPPR